GQPTRGPPVEVCARDHAVHVLLELFLPDETGCAGPIADQRIGQAAHEAIGPISRTAERLRANAHRVVRLVARQRLDRAVPERDTGVELWIERRVDATADRVEEARVGAVLPWMNGDPQR